MAKVRVHELAKDLNIPSKDLVTMIQDLGVDVKNHMSSLEQQQADWLKRKLLQPAGEENKEPVKT
ncbi:MAG: translation initiation factor IF-2 N-terminal domain-containing protein, partial [Acidobacteriota bacterium]